MGVVIPFPGSGSPRDPEPGRATAPRDESASAAEWAVPGLDRAVEDRDADAASEPASSRRAQNVSLAALTGHDSSEGQLRARLARKGLEPADVEAELARLRAAGLVDDRAFADRLIVRLRERKGLGDGALRAELRQRLIPPAVIDAALADATEDDDAAHDRLLEVAEDRARRLVGLAPEVAERRLLAYLQRRGFAGSEARDAARQALQNR